MDKPWKVILAFVGVFIAGSVFGGFFSLRIGQQMVQRGGNRLVQPQPQMPPLGVPLIRRFADRLDLTEEQRHDLFVEGFRHMPNGAEEAFELLLAEHKSLLWAGFRQRWNVVANEVSLA